jgi:hypothetical protein
VTATWDADVTFDIHVVSFSVNGAQTTMINCIGNENCMTDSRVDNDGNHFGGTFGMVHSDIDSGRVKAAFEHLQALCGGVIMPKEPF